MGEAMEGFFEWFLESSLLVLMILGIQKVFTGKIRYAGIYALWIVVFLRFMIPVNFISTPFSVGNIISEMVSSWILPEVSGQDSDGSAFLKGNPQQERGAEGVLDLSSVGMVSGKYQQPKASESQKQSDSFDEGKNHTQPVFFAGLRKLNWKLYLGTGWFVISLLLFLWLVLSNISMMRKLKRNRVPYGTRDKLKIYAVSGIKNPCLYGFLRPVIYLPEAFVTEGSGSRADEEELEQIITHEYVHYRHGDNIWSGIRMILAAVYWFDPFLWLAISQSKKDAELFCDETVIRLLGEENRINYGMLLVRIAGEATWGDFRYSMMPMSRRGKEMEKRIRAISETNQYSKWILIPLVLIVSVVVGITCSAGLGSMAKSEKAIDHVEAGNSADKETLDGEGKEEYGEEVQAANRVLEKQSVNPLEWLNNFDQSSMADFYSTPYIGEKAGEGKQGTAVLQNNDTENDSAGDEQKETVHATVYSSTYEEAFEHYMEIFTEAVNTGNVDKMHQVLDIDSDIYRQQSELAKNYYKRGIREKVKSFSVSVASTEEGADFDREKLGLQVEIDSKEVIKVSYADGSTKIIRQKYRYTCECIEQNWVITKMDEIS